MNNQEVFLRRIQKINTQVLQCLMQSYSEVIFAPDSILLNHASERVAVRIVQLLLHAGVSVQFRSQLQQTALHLAAQNGHSKVVVLLLNAQAEINPVDSDGYTPLHLAAVFGHTAIVKLLIQVGAKINTLSMTDHPSTALHDAVAIGHKEIVSLLLEGRADVNILDGCKQTPLHVAAACNCSQIIPLLLQANADVNALNCDQNTPLNFLIYRKSEAIWLLLKAGADINIKNHSQRTPLYVLILDHECEMVRIFLEAGAMVDIFDKINKTPLEIAFVSASASYSLNFYMTGNQRANAIDILVQLLSWYLYRLCTYQITDSQRATLESIKKLYLSSGYLRYFTPLLAWIFHEILTCTSKRQFIEKILEFLLKYPDEKQQWIVESMDYILLKEDVLEEFYLHSDALETKFSFAAVEKLKSILRCLYAKKMNRSFFINTFEIIKKSEIDFTKVENKTQDGV